MSIRILFNVSEHKASVRLWITDIIYLCTEVVTRA